MTMKIELTHGEANAIADLIDREVRLQGATGAALYGNIMRQMIEQAKAQNGPADGE